MMLSVLALEVGEAVNTKQSAMYPLLVHEAPASRKISVVITAFSGYAWEGT